MHYDAIDSPSTPPTTMSSTSSRPSLEAGPMHDNDQYTLTKMSNGTTRSVPFDKREREPCGDHEDGSGDDDRSKKKPKCGQKGTLDSFLGLTVKSGQKGRGSCEDTAKDKKEERAGLRDPSTSHELVVGVSKSAQNARKMREAHLSGTLVLKDPLLENFKEKIRVFDRNAEFKPLQLLVRHSKCGHWFKMRAAYSVTNFELHLPKCTGDNTILRYCKRTDTQQEPHTSSREVPCPGLSSRDDARIKTYLSRPTALGGGGRSKVHMALERFDTTYGELSPQDKREVDRLYEETWKWVIKHRYRTIHSTSCAKVVRIAATNGEGKGRAHLCTPCLSLLHDKHFDLALNVPEPLPSNFKHANTGYKNEELGIILVKSAGLDELLRPEVSCHFTIISRICYILTVFSFKNEDVRLGIRYAQAIAAGKFTGHDVFTGLVRNALQRLDREERGKKLTNFKHPPEFDEFMKNVFLLSPQVYKLLGKQFPMRSVRSIQ